MERIFEECDEGEGDRYGGLKRGVSEIMGRSR